MARDPQYGVELSAEELNSQVPMSVNYGITPNNKFIPLKIDSQGRLELGTGLTLNTDDIDIGDVVIKGVDPENANSEERIAVENLGSGEGFAVRTSIFSGGNQLGVNNDGSIDVNISGGSFIGTTDDDDNSITAGQTDVLLNLDLLYGYNGTNWERLKSDSNRLLVDGSQVTQPISATSLPLPTGAATSANQTIGNTSLSSIDSKIPLGLTVTGGKLEVTVSGATLEVNLDNANDDVLVYGQDSGAINRPLRTNTLGQAEVSVISSVLPTGAATETTLNGIKTQTDKLTFTGSSLDVNISGGVSSSKTDDDDGSIVAGQTDLDLILGLNYGYNGVNWERVKSSSGRLIIDGSQVTQPISAVSLPLPTGAATETTLSNLASVDFATETTLSSVKTQQTDGSQKTQIVDSSGNIISSTSNALDVNIKSGVTLEVNLDHTNDDVLIYGFDGAANQKIKTDIAGSVSINDGGNSITVDGPLTDAELRATPVPISGTVTANAGTGNFTVVQPTGTNLHVAVDNFPATQTVSGTVIAKIEDSAGNSLTSTSGALDVNIKNDVAGASSAVVTSVTRSNVSQTFLAINTSRKGATIYNDSSVLLYVKLGTTASTTDFTVRLSSQAYYEVPFGYTGRIDAIWPTNGAGNARITELS